MNPFHARAVDEDFHEWPWRRQLVDGAAVDFDGNPVLRRTVCVGLPEVGPERAADGIQESPQDAVLVERGDGPQCLRDAGLDLLAARLAGIGSRLAQCRIEARTEKIDQATDDRRIGRQRAFHVVLAEGHPGLPQVLGIGAQHGDLAPVEAGSQHQAIEPVVLERARPELLDRLDEARSGRREIDGRLVRRLDAQHLHRHAFARVLVVWRVQQERRLAQDTQAEVLGQRQDVGQRDRLARMKQADGETVRRQPCAAADLDVEPGAGQHFLQRLDVGDGLRRIEGLAIDRRKPPAPAAGGGAARGIAEFGLQHRAQPVVP